MAACESWYNIRMEKLDESLKRTLLRGGNHVGRADESYLEGRDASIEFFHAKRIALEVWEREAQL